MKRLSKLLILIFILIMVAVILIIVIKNLPSSFSTSDEENVENTQENYIDDTIDNENEQYYMIEPLNYKEAVFSYNGVTELIDVKRNLYQLVDKNIPKIYQGIKKQENLEEYYKEHTKEINEMNIKSKEDFIKIASKIKGYQISSKDEAYPKAEQYNSQDSKYYAFKLVLEYGGNRRINIIVNINKEEEEIKYGLYDELEDVYKNYQGSISKMEVEGAIYNIVSNAQTIFEKVDGVSVNKILQYYDLNKEEVNRYNIYDREAYLNVTNQIVGIGWRSNPKFRYYEVQKDTITNYKSSVGFDVKIVYSNGDSMTLNINLNVVSNIISVSAKNNEE